MQHENILKPVSKIVYAIFVHKKQFGLCVKELKYIDNWFVMHNSVCGLIKVHISERFNECLDGYFPLTVKTN